MEQKLKQADVYVLVSITDSEYRIVGVFARHGDAVSYADRNKVRGWNVYVRPFFAY